MHTAIDAPTAFSVNLCDFPELPANIRLDAEARYAKALERALGGAEAVAQAYGAYCYAADGDESDASPEDKAQALRWVKAVELARQAGFRGLSEGDGAYFEVRLG